MSQLDDRAAREAENYLHSLTRSHLVYQDPVVIGRSLDFNECVVVATWGAEDELGTNDEPEKWPVRVRVQNADGDDAEAYLTVHEAQQLVDALGDAIDRARTYPQPEDTLDMYPRVSPEDAEPEGDDA